MKELWHRIWAANPYLVDGILGAFIIVTSLGSLFASSHFQPQPQRSGDVLAVLLVTVAGGGR
jgi:hypothetical protein